jgi:CRISPR-associated exonuclease Cas4
MEDDIEWLPLSALQHYLYCPRQCALIHLEQQWAENRYTAEGLVLHQRADLPITEQRRGVRTVSAMPLAAPSLGINGIADIVEFHHAAQGDIPCPVEYKRGRPKAHRADEVQLCAQGLCLESMFGCDVPEGALYYGKIRHRKIVAFDKALRELTLETIANFRKMMVLKNTPTARYQARRCDACSLIDVCQPRILGSVANVTDWVKQQLRD